MAKLNSDGYLTFSNADTGISPHVPRAFVSKESRVQEVVENLDGFYLYNPEIEKGVLIVGVSACSEGESYQISPFQHTDNLVVCDTMKSQINVMVAPLERRLSGIVGLDSVNVRKLLYARVYWVTQDNKSALLLDNFEWFNRKHVAKAFSKVLIFKYDNFTGCKAENVNLRLVKFGNIRAKALLMWSYEYAEGKYLMCSTVSGAIVDSADVEDFQMSEIADQKRFFVLMTRVKIENCDTLSFM